MVDEAHFAGSVGHDELVTERIPEPLRDLCAEHRVEDVVERSAVVERERPGASIPVVLEVRAGRPHHPKAAVRIAEQDRHRPPNPGEARDVPVALPGNVAGGVPDAKDRVEQELDRAAARPDDEVGARDRVGERAARIAPYLLHAEQHRDAERNGKQGQSRRDAAVQHAEERQPNDRHQSSRRGVFTSFASSQRPRSGGPSLQSAPAPFNSAMDTRRSNRAPIRVS